jgi:hypothetical protein
MSTSGLPVSAARVAARYLPHQSPEQLDALLRCFDLAVLRRRLAVAGLCPESAGDDALLEAYFTRDDCARISPNELFNETWYRSHYPDVAAAAAAGGTSGFVHFIAHGWRESRWPTQTLYVAGTGGDPHKTLTALDETEYVALNPAARAFLEAFPVLTATEHYNLYGRFLHLTASTAARTPVVDARSALVAMLESEFDPAFYADAYLKGASPEDLADPFRHYLTVGIEREHSPNRWFEEDWYRAFYPDVRSAIPRDVLCGFHHYLARGRREGRLPRFDLTAALEAKLPGVTAPVLIGRTQDLRYRIYGARSLRAFRRRGAPERGTVWFLLPTLNPDISFGGYQAAFELIRALRAAGREVAIYCTEDAGADKGYFLWREHSEKIRAAFENISLLGRDEDHRIGIGPNDRVVVYSVWDLFRAAPLAEWTDLGRPFLLAQEYEPVFFDNSSSKALCHEAYSVPHYPIINSRQLRDYFRAHRVGVFAADDCEEIEHYALFEHRINQLPRQTVASMSARTRKMFALYARPELHASRNLFEITLLALQNLCARDVFGDEWSFVGIGALSDVPPIDLGGGHRLALRQRTTEQEYREMLQSLDIGVSMMYAPHPGVVALEFATTGALVVTNVYENRSADELERLCANIIPCEPSLRDLERAIAQAVAASVDHAARERNAYRPVLRSWDEIFSRDFVERVFRLDA